MDNEQIAIVCHEANRSYCAGIGDNTQLQWDDAPEWQRESAINGVEFHQKNPEAGDDHSHIEWMAEKVAAGWVWGEHKDADTKHHPCIVPFNELPLNQQKKDTLFRAIVHALSD